MPFPILLLLWFVAACIAGALGLVAQLHPPQPQLVLGGLTVGVIVLGRSVPSYRAWLLAIDWRRIVGFHVTRFVGFLFLWLYRQGALPGAFAVPAGIGDVIVATLALALVVSGSAAARRPRLIFAWNVVGLLDILFVVFRATRLAIQSADSMAALLQFPLSLIPTFLVPLIIASHVLLFARLRRWPAQGPT